MHLVFIFLIGLCVGSFLNVVILRTKEGTSPAKGRSQCPFCHAILKMTDLIPLGSYLWLRGKCRYCHTCIGLQCPLMELTTGLGFVLIYLRYFLGFSLPGYFSESLFFWFCARDAFLFCVLLVIAVYDLRYTHILDRFTLPVLLILFPLQFFLGMSFESLVLGALVLASFFGAQYVLSGGTWVGGGDLRLGALMGVALGVSQGLLALFLAYVIGAGVAIVLLATKKATRKTQIPFGPFLAGATFFILFAGDWIVTTFL